VCIYIYIYIYKYIFIYTRNLVSHTLSLVCTHTRTRRGGWVKGQRGRGTVGHRGRGPEGMGGGVSEELGGGGLEWDNVGYVHQLHLGTSMFISWVVR